jgi:hypothetical protein
MGTVVVTRSTLSSNVAGSGGGGGGGGSGQIGGADGSSGPGGVGSSGGGIWSDGGSLSVANSTLYNNSAGGGGAGGTGTYILNPPGAGGNGGGGGNGGAIAIMNGASSLLNATVDSNDTGSGGSGGSPGGSNGADGLGGGIYVQSATSADDMLLQNTIVAASAFGANCAGSSSSAITDAGHDLSFPDNTCPGINADPKLLGLMSYGGPTQTLALASGSAAIDQVPATGAACPATDQRGVKRPQGVACDIGAFEFNGTMVVGGQITGTVTDSATNAALLGICVQAYDSGGGKVASTQTNPSGVYTLNALPTGAYRVGFADCAADSAGSYVTQYYNGKATLASADPIAVTAGTTTSGINAAMVAHGEITGTVTDSASQAPLAGICVGVYDSTGSIVGSVATDSNGAYVSPRLSAGSYRIGFFNCGASGYASQYYNDRATLSSADPIAVTDGSTSSGINAALVGDTPPTVATGSANQVGAGAVTVAGTVTPNGTATYHFDYGTSTNYGSQAPAPPDPSAGSGTTAQIESTTLTGLSQNTVYHYRIEATNASGTSYGTDQTFTTTGTSPYTIVATGPATNIGSDAATVTGTITTGEVATYHFDYGTSTNYTSHTITEPVSGASGGTEVDARLTGLRPNTVYHYRIEATDAWGTHYGTDKTFTTTAGPSTQPALPAIPKPSSPGTGSHTRPARVAPACHHRGDRNTSYTTGSGTTVEPRTSAPLHGHQTGTPTPCPTSQSPDLTSSHVPTSTTKRMN